MFKLCGMDFVAVVDNARGIVRVVKADMRSFVSFYNKRDELDDDSKIREICFDLLNCGVHSCNTELDGKNFKVVLNMFLGQGATVKGVKFGFINANTVCVCSKSDTTYKFLDVDCTGLTKIVSMWLDMIYVNGIPVGLVKDVSLNGMPIQIKFDLGVSPQENLVTVTDVWALDKSLVKADNANTPCGIKKVTLLDGAVKYVVYDRDLADRRVDVFIYTCVSSLPLVKDICEGNGFDGEFILNRVDNADAIALGKCIPANAVVKNISDDCTSICVNDIYFLVKSESINTSQVGVFVNPDDYVAYKVEYASEEVRDSVGIQYVICHKSIGANVYEQECMRFLQHKLEMPVYDIDMATGHLELLSNLYPVTHEVGKSVISSAVSDGTMICAVGFDGKVQRAIEFEKPDLKYDLFEVAYTTDEFYKEIGGLKWILLDAGYTPEEAAHLISYASGKHIYVDEYITQNNEIEKGYVIRKVSPCGSLMVVDIVEEAVRNRSVFVCLDDDFDILESAKEGELEVYSLCDRK